MTREEVTREKLYELVWSTPMLKLGEKFGVSSSYLARVCQSMNVPRPPRGHWAKLEAGKKSVQPPLPAPASNDLLSWSVGIPINFDNRKTRRVKGSNSIQMRRSRNVSSPHPLIDQTKPLFLKGRKRDNGLLYPSKRLLVDILVSEKALDNLLSFADKFFIELEKNGYSIDLAPNHMSLTRTSFDVCKSANKTAYTESQWGPSRPTVIFVDSIAIGVSLYEQTDEIDVLYVNGDYIPKAEIDEKTMKKYSRYNTWSTTKERTTGRFCLRLYSPYQSTSWSKTIEIKSLSPVGMATKLAKGFKRFATEISAQVRKSEEDAKQRRKEWEEEKLRLRAQEQTRRKQEAIETSHRMLIAAIDEWRRIKSIEMFFDEIEQDLASVSEDQKDQLLARLSVAREFIVAEKALDVINAWKAPDEVLLDMPKSIW